MFMQFGLACAADSLSTMNLRPGIFTLACASQVQEEGFRNGTQPLSQGVRDRTNQHGLLAEHQRCLHGEKGLRTSHCRVCHSRPSSAENCGPVAPDAEVRFRYLCGDGLSISYPVNRCGFRATKAVEVGQDNRGDFKMMGKAYARIAKGHFLMGNLEEASRYYDRSLSNARTPAVLAEKKKVIVCCFVVSVFTLFRLSSLRGSQAWG